MCGINGYIFKSKPFKENIISDMNASIHHRGPDDRGIHKDKVLNKYSDQMNDERRRRQQAIDSFEEYEAIGKQCKSERKRYRY